MQSNLYNDNNFKSEIEKFDLEIIEYILSQNTVFTKIKNIKQQNLDKKIKKDKIKEILNEIEEKGNQLILKSFFEKQRFVCRKKNIRPCSYYQIKQCEGICINQETFFEYNQKLLLIKQIFEGRTTEISNYLKQNIDTAVENENYSLASYYRDKLFILDFIEQKQTVVLSKNIDIDVFTFIFDSSLDILDNWFCSIFVQNIRQGKIVNLNNFIHYNNVNKYNEDFYKNNISSYPQIIIENMIKDFCAYYYQFNTDFCDIYIDVYNIDSTN